jgi:HK97 family phage portal protein
MSGLFGALAAGAERKSAAVLDQLPWFMFTPASKAGPTVNHHTALQVATVLSCVRVLAEGVAQVPFKLYRARKAGGADPAADHPLYSVLYRRPNGWQTSFEFRETVMLHLILCGNAFVYKNMVGGRVHELIPLEPGNVNVTRNADLTLAYSVRGQDGIYKPVPAELMWHLRGPSWNSWMGMEAVKLAREAIGLSLALEESHAQLHKNGSQTSGAYAVEGNLSGEQHAQLTKWIKEHTTGPNKHAPLVLDRGAKWLAQQMSGVDAQHLETRKHQIEEVCRFFRVFPQMVGHAGDQTPTFASAEQFFIAHVVHSLQPWCERIEQSADVNLVPANEPDLYVKFNLNGLLRGASKDRSEYLAKALGAGGAPAWMTQDEVRALEELNPMGGAAATLREPTNVAKTTPADPGSNNSKD